MQTSVVPQERFSAIEGLRGYMALWVLAAHCLGAAGYEIDQLHGVIKMIRDAGYAVDVFVIVSGFVISRLIIKSRERYIVFIGRRFFRLFPLYALCMVAGAMLTNLLIWNLNASGEWITEQRLHSELHIITSIFQNFWENVALCTLMLQGVVPQSIVPYAPNGFLGTAWSISTIFVLQGIVYKNLGPFASIKDSLITLKKTWGESLTSQFSVSIIFTLTGTIIFLPCLLLILTFIPALMILGILIFLPCQFA